jgi:hypothetical protein
MWNTQKCKQFALFMMIVLACFGFFCLITQAEAASSEQGNEILIIGSSRIIKENMARAREEALREGMFKGVESYLISRLGKQRMSDNFILLSQEIIPRAAGYIQNYHILSQERVDDSYRVFLSIRINEALMEKTLNEFDILAPEGTQLKILFLVSEFNTANNEERYWWKAPEEGMDLTPVELALFRFFQDRGFQPINRLSGLADETYDMEMTSSSLTLAQAIQWGQLYSADVVLQGRFELIADNSVVVNIKAINVHQASLVSQLNYIQMPDEKSSADSQSNLSIIEKAVQAAAQKLGPAIIQSTDKPKTQLTELLIHLSGLKNLKQKQMFLDFIKTRVKGVQSIIPVEIKNRSISYSVRYLGDTVSFIKALSGDSGLPLEAAIQIRNENVISIVIL